MSWIWLIVIGAIIALCSLLPFPHPIPRILQIVGAIFVIIGVVLLILALLATGTSDVDTDTMKALILLG